MSKQYRYDYHSADGWLNRSWLDAENDDQAMAKALDECRWFKREFLKGSLKEIEKHSAKEHTDAMFEQHAMSFVKGVNDND